MSRGCGPEYLASNTLDCHPHLCDLTLGQEVLYSLAQSNTSSMEETFTCFSMVPCQGSSRNTLEVGISGSSIVKESLRYPF